MLFYYFPHDSSHYIIADKDNCKDELGDAFNYLKNDNDKVYR